MFGNMANTDIMFRDGLRENKIWEIIFNLLSTVNLEHESEFKSNLIYMLSEVIKALGKSDDKHLWKIADFIQSEMWDSNQNQLTTQILNWYQYLAYFDIT